MADLACDSRGILVCFDNITGCRKKCITILHQVGVSFDFFWREVARIQKSKFPSGNNYELIMSLLKMF